MSFVVESPILEMALLRDHFVRRLVDWVLGRLTLREAWTGLRVRRQGTAGVWVATEERARELAARVANGTWREVSADEMPAKARARMERGT